MFTDDLTQWERRHPTSAISYFLSVRNLLHFKTECAGEFAQWVPGDIVEELWELGNWHDEGEMIPPRRIGWCERCTVKRKEANRMANETHERPMVQATVATETVKNLPKLTGKDTGETAKDLKAGREQKPR